ncbi:hypothetical protein [Paraburkholderia sp.]|jgi:hypothetical protein|uniref:hypothetical protein n=1 Tax=Paraburkholderia sp. TaxID=1926495 RepID=UPI002F428974
MLPVRLIRILQGAVVPVLFTTLSLSAPAAFAASGGQPLILDTQHGISDGQGGTVLQTAPLSHQRIVQAQPIASPTELAPNSSGPLIVEPYIQLPRGGGTPTPRPKPQPRPAPPQQ